MMKSRTSSPAGSPVRSAGPGFAIPAPPRHAVAGPIVPSAHILVADGNPPAAARLAGRLHRRGHAVVLACEPGEILGFVRLTHFDLVIADAGLPGGGEGDWVERLLALPDAPAVALISHHPSLPLAIRAANLPLVGCFDQPLDDAQLDTLVQRALARPRLD